MPHPMVRGFAARVKPRGQPFAREGPGKEPATQTDAQVALTDSLLSCSRFSRFGPLRAPSCPNSISQKNLDAGTLLHPHSSISTCPAS